MSSFAIAVRVFDGEAPYLQAFIDHHRRLGIDAFYPVLAPGAASLCREIFARNGVAVHESDGQRISSVQDLIREDYVAVIDADEYLHSGLFDFLVEEKVESLSMPWRLTASLDDDFFESSQKKFFVFPQVKSIVKTSALKLLRLHESNTNGSGRRLGIAQGQHFPVQHYYLRGLDDLLLKEGGVVKRTLAQSSGRKPVSLSGNAESLDFPSRHARVAYLLKILDSVSPQADPYGMALDRLRANVEGDPEVAKQALRDSVVKIQSVYRNRTIRCDINAMQQLLAHEPLKISYQKRVLKLLRQDFQFRRSWLGRLEKARDSLLMPWS